MSRIAMVEENSVENEENIEETSDKEDSEEDLDSDSDSSSVSHSSDISIGKYEHLIDEYNTNLTELEEHFYSLREAYKKEKLNSLNSQLIQLIEETSIDFLQPVEELSESKKERIQIAEIVRDFRAANATSNFEADMIITKQDFENEKILLKDRIRQDIEEKIKKLNEDRYKADNDFFMETSIGKRPRKNSYYDEFSDIKRIKPTTVSGPYIVYMLKDEEIIEDLNFIKYQSFSRPYKSYKYF